MPVAGQLNTLIDILRPTDTQTAGTGETTTTYAKYHRKVPAAKEDTSGGSTRRGLQVEEDVKSVFTIPFIEDIAPSWRVQVVNKQGDGPTFEIISVLERDDRRRWIELHCGDVR